MGEHRGLSIRDLLGLHHNVKLTTSLHSIGALNAIMGVRNLFELLETLDVGLGTLTASTGARGGNGVSGHHELIKDGVGLNICVVSLDSVYDLRALAITAGKISADNGMRSLNLVVNRLADIVEKTGALGKRRVETELGSHDAAKLRNLLGVRENILSKGSAVTESAERLHDLGVKIMDPSVEGCLFASLLNPLLHESLRLLIHLLDAGGVNAAICDQVLESNASRLATNWLKAGEEHRLRRIVDYERNTRDLLEGANISTLATDDTAFEVIGRDVNRGYRDLTGLIGSTTLNGSGDDLASGLVRLGAGTLLALAKNLRLLANSILADAIEKLLVSLVSGKGGNALELGSLLLHELIKVRLATVKLASLAGELVLATIKGVIAAIKGLFALHDAAFHGSKLALALLLLSLGGLTLLKDILLSGENSFLLRGLSLTLCIVGNLLGLLLGLRNLTICILYSSGVLTVDDEVRNCKTNCKRNKRCNNDDLDTHSDS